ncbi:MAG: hypothetical protein JEZ04_10960 [Spirochaetales bacterium]|nr:hypothetical protein [Spirochaetales bacterium]
MQKKVVIILAVIFALLVSCTSTNSENRNSSATGAAGNASAGTQAWASSLHEAGNAASNTDAAGGDSSTQARAGGIDAEEITAAPPLGRAALLQTVGAQLPWNMVTVHDEKGPLVTIHDLDKNGYEDVLVIAVEGGMDTDSSTVNLSKSSRLFEAEKDFFNYFLLIFYQYDGSIMLRYTVPVSRQLVFSGMRPFEIKRGSDFPYALLFTFRTRSGIEQELVILSGYGITSLSLRENLSEFTHIDDIDDDGYTDIVLHEQGFEEGTGFETFLTWYKWNLREYTEYKNTNIVRNLRAFFNDCSMLLKEGSFKAFFEFALDAEGLRELKKQGLTDSEILYKIFPPADGSPGYDDFFLRGDFTAVVFPEIMETPFSYDTRNEFRHTVSVRFSRHGGESLICLGELRMKRNPFQDRQFCFCPGIK